MEVLYKDFAEMFSDRADIPLWSTISNNKRKDWVKALPRLKNAIYMRGIKPTVEELYYRLNNCMIHAGYAPISSPVGAKLDLCVSNVYNTNDAQNVNFTAETFYKSTDATLVVIASAPLDSEMVPVNGQFRCAPVGCDVQNVSHIDYGGYTWETQGYECGFAVMYQILYITIEGYTLEFGQIITWYPFP